MRGRQCGTGRGAGVLHEQGWAGKVHRRVREVPELPCGEAATRVVRIGGWFLALLTLLICTMRSMQGSEHGIERASGAVRHAARDMGAETAREVR